MTNESMIGVRRAVALLKLLARRPEGCTFSEIQQIMELSSPTALTRLLKVLSDEELIGKSERYGTYGLARGALSISRAVLGSFPVEEAVEPILRRLAEESGESASYWEFRGDRLMLLAKVEVPGRFHYMRVLGRAQEPTHGFVLACVPFLDGELKHALLDGIGNSSNPVPDLDSVLARAQRQKVLVVDPTAMSQLCRVAAPVFFMKAAASLHGGRIVRGAIGITYHLDREPIPNGQSLAGLVKTAAKKVGELLSAHPF